MSTVFRFNLANNPSSCGTPMKHDGVKWQINIYSLAVVINNNKIEKATANIFETL
jgi:hypothetical protein